MTWIKADGERVFSDSRVGADMSPVGGFRAFGQAISSCP